MANGPGEGEGILQKFQSKGGPVTDLTSNLSGRFETKSDNGDPRKEGKDEENHGGPMINAAGISLFSMDSGDEGNFRKLLSWGRRQGSRNTENEPREEHKSQGTGKLFKRTSSMLPPNYSSVFVDRTPALTIVSKRSQWALEIVAMSSNGVRQELRDMYKMLTDMERRPLTLTTDDMDIFLRWFGTFGRVLEILFELEEKCLYAWVEGKDQMSEEDLKWQNPHNTIKGDLSEGRRMKRKGLILQRLITVQRSGSDMFTGRPVAERLPELAVLLDEFVRALLQYLEAKESHLPRVVMDNLTQKDRRRYEQLYWSSLLRAAGNDRDIANIVTVSITRCMGRRQRSRWRRKYFKGMSRREYALAQKAYFREHYSLIKELEGRVAADEVERIQMAAENAALRARADAVGDWPAEQPIDTDDDSLATLSVASSVKQI